MKKLLIIEDDTVLLRMYVSKFKSGDYQIITAIDGETGIDEAVRSRPDFIILDLRLPKADGLQVLRILKEIPEVKDIPVAILTVVQQDIALRNDPQLMSKTVAYFRKDEITPSELLQKVGQYLKDHA